jgi:hypothetical protein
MYKILKEVTFDMARAGVTSLRELTAVEKNIYIGLQAIDKTDVQQYQRYLTEIRLSIHKPYGYGKSIWNFHMDMDRMDIWITYGHMEINLASGYNTTFRA